MFKNGFKNAYKKYYFENNLAVICAILLVISIIAYKY